MNLFAFLSFGLGRIVRVAIVNVNLQVLFIGLTSRE
jgi:hypothetical protein